MHGRAESTTDKRKSPKLYQPYIRGGFFAVQGGGWEAASIHGELGIPNINLFF